MRGITLRVLVIEFCLYIFLFTAACLYSFMLSYTNPYISLCAQILVSLSLHLFEQNIFLASCEPSF